ncbi:hypothetical protein Gorai_021981 [Gossypium raimondii]|uniref:Uncharacterized protein n=1 Tax=Gossypium raimondii TaxID=29730 RepID=A0A7J8NRW8_GOSRA|nr:hypothetical protein [Gossypium raimondii]
MEIDPETIALETNNPGKATKKVRRQEDDLLDEESDEDGFNLNWGDVIIEQSKDGDGKEKSMTNGERDEHWGQETMSNE